MQSKPLIVSTLSKEVLKVHNKLYVFRDGNDGRTYVSVEAMYPAIQIPFKTRKQTKNVNNSNNRRLEAAFCEFKKSVSHCLLSRIGCLRELMLSFSKEKKTIGR